MNDNYHFSVAFIYYWKRNLYITSKCAGMRVREKLVGVRDRFFLNSLPFSFVFAYLCIPFIHSSYFVRDLPRKSGKICVTNRVNPKQFRTAFFFYLNYFLSFFSHFTFLLFFLSFSIFSFFFLSCAPRAVCTVKNSESSLKRVRKKWHKTHAFYSSDINFTHVMNVNEFIRKY